MEDFERLALESVMHPPRWWKCRCYIHSTLEASCTGVHRPPEKHIDDDFKWTTEGEVITHTPGEEEVNISRALAFLNTWSVGKENGSIKNKMYPKETHI